jgi:hypothetical protein
MINFSIKNKNSHLHKEDVIVDLAIEIYCLLQNTIHKEWPAIFDYECLDRRDYFYIWTQYPGAPENFCFIVNKFSFDFLLHSSGYFIDCIDGRGIDKNMYWVAESMSNSLKMIMLGNK